MELFAKRLRDLRTEKKLKQSELAQIFHVRNTTVSAWENNVSEPDYDTLTKLAKYFEVSTDYLLGLVEV